MLIKCGSCDGHGLIFTNQALGQVKECPECEGAGEWDDDPDAGAEEIDLDAPNANSQVDAFTLLKLAEEIDLDAPDAREKVERIYQELAAQGPR